jgi:(1->4)-alpha-D-glucan 1-alpha-D-glucosylmutase
VRVPLSCRDLSLVDPDNRRSMDFNVRVRGLRELVAGEQGGRRALRRQLLRSWRDGRAKQYTVYKGLELRGRYAQVFRDGDYEAV